MDWREWVEAARRYLASEWGLEDGFAGQVALFYAYLFAYGLNPRITSGYRDPAKQKAMQQAWDRGQRAGLKVRPADSSDHTKRKAIDIDTNNPALAAQIAKACSIGAGYDFKVRDPVHFFKKA